MKQLALIAVASAWLAACDADPTRPNDAILWPEPPVLATVASEQDAVAISNNIQLLHVPYGTVIDPIFGSSDPASPDYARLDNYTRAGDAAIWTGHYLAAESFRYKVTRSAGAARNLRSALEGITALVDITGTDLLARFLIPTSSPYVENISNGEKRHGRYEGTLRGQSYYWFGNTSRDQYSGVFFGLGNAYDHADARTRVRIRKVVSRLLDFLLRNNWNVVMPDGKISTTFNGRADQQLSFLQVGRHVNPDRYSLTYQAHRAALAPAVILPILAECQDPHNSYFKFNLAHINLYNLVRLEEPASPFRGVYLNAFNTLRGCTGHHQNAHFNMVDRGLKGADLARDAETRQLLDLWLKRARRDYAVDRRGQYLECGENRACEPLPVDQRPNTDFLWQRSPFQLYGGGSGTIETAAIDYILPYWMARYYGVLLN